MKTKIILMLSTLLTFIFSDIIIGQNDFPILKGPYLGQKPPGIIPKVFAPGIISTDVSEGCVSFTHDNNIFLFTRSGIGILIMQQVNGRWTKPGLAPFSEGKCDWDFMLAPDDKTVFVSSGRSDEKDGNILRNYRIWVSERNGYNWSTPVLLPAPINTGQHDSYPSVTEKGTLYFFSNRNGGLGEGDIYRSRKYNEKYPEIENLSKPINTKYHEVDPYITPDESYLIFCSEKPDGFGKADIYVTFRKKDGNWTKPVNMGDKINSSYSEYIPYVTPDGKYFFFTTNKSGNRDIYWVDARIIEELKPNELK